MLKKLTSAVTISALAALSLVSITAADTGNVYLDISNGDENEEGTVGQPKVQPAVIVGSEPTKLNIGAGDDNDKPTVSGNSVKLNIGASDPAEQ